MNLKMEREVLLQMCQTEPTGHFNVGK